MFHVDEEKKRVTRRQFLSAASTVSLGAAALTGGGSLPSLAEARGAKYPWPYKKIDPKKAAGIAYENWYRNFCCYATASGILIPLREAVGEPYTSLPLEAFVFGHGGTVGWGTLCGTLLGSAIATSFAAGKAGEDITNDIIYWYTDTELPIYKPEHPRATFRNINKSKSPLCHVSVGKWMKKEGVNFFSPQRKDRCARLSADVAAKTIMLLNDWADGTYKPIHHSQVNANQITSQNNCTECHGG